jgi:hypothetical protein
MHTLIKEPLLQKKVLREDYKIVKEYSTLRVVHKDFLEPRTNFKDATDLFKGNADFIHYGISAMTHPF